MKQWELTGELRRRIEKVFDEKRTELRWYYPKPYFGEN